MNRYYKLQSSVALLLLVAGTNLRAADPAWLVRGSNGVVASDSKYASEAGIEVLRDGGNAIDAAVAVSFTLAVTRPYSTGLGGGAFLIVRFANGCIVVQDSRETAPLAATAEMYVKRRADDPEAPPPSRYGFGAVGVPGLVAGRCAILERFGTLPLGRVAEPAIRLARDGYAVDKGYVKNTREALDSYEKYPVLKSSCDYVFETHLRKGALRQAGDILRQPKLAKLLELIAEGGADAFYRGPVADAMALTMSAHGGIITRQDLADYDVVDRKPLISNYRSFEIIGMPPPSSGGIALAEMLNILDRVELPALAERNPMVRLHCRIEAMKHAFADRARWMGDADFVDVPVAHLISTDYAQELADRINLSATADPDSYGTKETDAPAVPLSRNDAGTSHFCIADQWGNVVVSTETINTEFGSLAAVNDWGLILNNEMDDFAAEPGKPNAYGLLQSDRNRIQPLKRPLSSMTPTIVLKDGEPYMALGASGGPRIITSIFHVLLAVTDDKMPLAEAMMDLRPHHQWSPNALYFDRAPFDDVRNDLISRGHKLSDRPRTGVVQVIMRTKHGWIGASDPRKGGIPAAY